MTARSAGNAPALSTLTAPTAVPVHPQVRVARRQRPSLGQGNLGLTHPRGPIWCQAWPLRPLPGRRACCRTGSQGGQPMIDPRRDDAAPGVAGAGVNGSAIAHNSSPRSNE